MRTDWKLARRLFLAHHGRMWGYVIEWGAWATFATGVMAVGAALKIGLKQTAIAERQLGLMEQQSKLELAKHTADLFDRRYEIYDAVRDFIVVIMRTGGRPDRVEQVKFQNAIAMNALLFKPEVQQNLKRIEEKAAELFAALLKNKNAARIGGVPDADTVEKVEALFNELAAKAVFLPDEFGEELVLGGQKLAVSETVSDQT